MSKLLSDEAKRTLLREVAEFRLASAKARKEKRKRKLAKLAQMIVEKKKRRRWRVEGGG